jgi:hypothetical protein
MTNQEFCYWLQGFFELRAENDALTATQVECIRRHTDLVKESLGKPGPAVLAIRALLPYAERSDDITRAVQSILSDVFEHVIDPQAGEASPHLSHVHNPGGPLTRC